MPVKTRWELAGEVSAHFGRCAHYTFLEVEEGKVKGCKLWIILTMENHIPGKVPEFIHSQKADVMIAGGMGPQGH